MLKKINIEGLFDTFNYEIELKDDGITILTGPNGYGKTTILNIINSLYLGNPFFFFKLPFKTLKLEYSDKKIFITKKDKTIIVNDGNENITFNKTKLFNNIKKSLRNTEYQPIDNDRWINRYTEEIVTTDFIIDNLFLELFLKKHIEFDSKFPQIKPPVIYLIKEQRLLKQNNKLNSRRVMPDRISNVFIETIKEYSFELKNEILKTIADNAKIIQELDSNFSLRIIKEEKKISKKEFENRFEKVKQKYQKLSKYGLAPSNLYLEHSYSQENAKVLLVYIQDTEQKLSVFDDLLGKLDLFTDILNKRRLLFKQIQITEEEGFKFITDKKNDLNPTDLSSGEQHEVVMLYELIFKVTPDTLVLIDEPEISLHVVWQKAFVEDLKEIAKIQKFNTIIATHSPQIINNDWDSVIDLEDISQ